MADRRGRTAAEALAVILVLGCVLAGLLSGRPDTAALAAPFALLVVASRSARSRTDGSTVQLTRDPGARDDGRALLRLTSADDDEAAPGAARLVLTVLATGSRSLRAVVLRSGEHCPLLVDTPFSGESEILTHRSVLVGADLSDPVECAPAPPVRITVLPVDGPALARPASSRLRGLAGAHGSRRPGDGGDLRSVDPLQPGDQVRRIDWRATARRSTDQDRLMVRRTFAEAEATVFLVIDSAHDLPAVSGDWFATDPRPGIGSLHVARTAATTVAASFLAIGDRVGLADLAGTRRPVRSAAGPRQLENLRAHLATTSVVRRQTRRDPTPPPGSLVVILSPFLDGEPGRLLRTWRAQGHVVVGIDCLPALLRTETTTAQVQTVRLTLLRRRIRIEELTRVGIPVVAGAGTDGTGTAGALPDLMLGFRLLARAARTNRPGRVS